MLIGGKYQGALRRSLIAAAIVLCLVSSAYGQNEISYLKGEAHRLGLAQRVEWLRLLHYSLGSKASDISARSFFLSPRGRTDPEAELFATIDALFSPASKAEHAQCRYPARFHWLQDTLALTGHGLIVQRCDRFTVWFNAINAKKVTLVYAAAFLNNPASMFGHTLLRLDQSEGSEPQPLLSYVVNFAADLEGDPGLLFALKGVFGGYNGYYSIAPYYEKIRMYNDIEDRDLWEYPLSLSSVQIERLLEHLWELRGVPFSYYYFDRNCSDQLLALIEAANPALDLRSSLDAWVIPSETLKGLLGTNAAHIPVYRASPGTSLRKYAALLPSDQISAASMLRAANRDERKKILAPFDDAAKAHILELAFDWLEYDRVAGKVQRKDVAARERALLVERSKESAPKLFSRIDPDNAGPAEGHAPWRMSVGPGEYHRKNFFSVDLRPAYHDYRDRPDGFLKGAEINLGEGEVRLVEGHGLSLEQLSLVHITSLSPRDRILKPVSWGLDTDLTRHYETVARRTLVGAFRAGLGMAWDTLPKTLSYALIGSSLRYDFQEQSSVNVGPRLEIGMQMQRRYGQVGVRADYARYLVNDEFSEASIGMDVHVPITKSIGFFADLKEQKDRSRPYASWLSGLRIYWE